MVNGQTRLVELARQKKLAPMQRNQHPDFLGIDNSSASLASIQRRHPWRAEIEMLILTNRALDHAPGRHRNALNSRRRKKHNRAKGNGSSDHLGGQKPAPKSWATGAYPPLAPPSTKGKPKPEYEPRLKAPENASPHRRQPTNRPGTTSARRPS